MSSEEIKADNLEVTFTIRDIMLESLKETPHFIVFDDWEYQILGISSHADFRQDPVE